MRYFVNLDPAPDSKPIVVDVSELPSGAVDVTVDGKRVEVDVVATSGALSVRVDGRVVDLVTEGRPPELGFIANGRRAFARVESERQRDAGAGNRGAGGGADEWVKAPMPGRIVKLLVGAGTDISAGQTICVVEAMKMENEVKAKTAGKVLEVHVTEGATVEGNAKLFTLG